MQASTNTPRTPGRSAGRGAQLAVSTAFLLAILLVAGCSGSQGTQQALEDRQALEDQQQQNEELQEEQEEARQQIEQLEEEQEEQAEQAGQAGQEEQAAQNQEPQVVIENNESIATAAPEGVVAVAPSVPYGNTDPEWEPVQAAIEYYQAAELGDWEYTYMHLSRPDQAYYTYDEWVYANNALETAAGEFVVYDIYQETAYLPVEVYNVGVTIYTVDGTSFDRRTQFVWENGRWVHHLTDEEVSLFDSVL